jgi:putative DNA primase/helicase
MNDKTADSSDVLVFDPDASQKGAKPEDFAKLLAEAKALKPGDDAGMQDLMYRAARSKLDTFQAEDLIQAIHKSTGRGLGVLRDGWKKFRKEARKEEEAAAAAAGGPSGSGGAGGAGSAGAYWSNVGSGGALGNFVLDATGLYRLDGKRWDRISQGFEVLGLARSTEDGDWGKVVRFSNADKRIHEEIVTAPMLHNDLKGVIGRLANHGMFITGKPDGRLAFAEYLLLEEETDKRVTVANSTGWIEIGGHLVFVLPNKIIGAAPDELVTLAKGVGAPYAHRGTLEDWRDAIAKPAGDHLMLRFAISTSLSGTLLHLGGFESGIAHLHGSSSFGKTTMLRIAASSWGSGADNGFVRLWRSTDNALEATLASSNDTLLPLDELGQADPRAVGPMVYMVAGSTGKTRMSRDATVKPSYQWRALVLSSGEKPIAVLLALGQGKHAHAGQLVRAIDIKVDRKQGAFDAFSQSADILDASAFAESLKRAALTCYGTAGPAFVQLLIDAKIDSDNVRLRVDTFTKETLKDVKGDRGQVVRAAQRFGIIAAAGELAIELGLLPWPEGQPTEDANILFKAWLDERGGAGAVEPGQMIAQVRLFWDEHGDSRFDDLDPLNPNPVTGQEHERRPVNNRAGYRKGEGDEQRWYVPPEVWKSEICVGLDPRAVAKVLIDLGMMEPGEGGKQSKVVRLPKLPPKRFYVIKPSIFEG